MNNKKCYGNYRESVKCNKCKMLAYCKESKDIPLSGWVNYDNADHMEELAVDADVFFDEETVNAIGVLGSCLMDCVEIFLKLKERNPITYQVIAEKIKDPSLSYSELAEKFDCKKQNIQYHLKKAVKMFPILKNALLVDKRFNKNSITKKVA